MLPAVATLVPLVAALFCTASRFSTAPFRTAPDVSRNQTQKATIFAQFLAGMRLFVFDFARYLFWPTVIFANGFDQASCPYFRHS
eukprot:3871891-Rhodomonas_salina.5